MKKGFVFCGINNLSQEICREIINRHTEVAQVLNMEKDLTWNSEETIVRDLSRLAETFDLYFMPDVPLNRMRKWEGLSKVQFLSSEIFSGQLPIVLQVAALVQHQPTRFIHEVAALEQGGIPELYKMGVEPREIAYLAFRNRLASGSCTLQTEHAAEKYIKNADIVSNKYFFYDVTSPDVQWAIVDAIYAQNPKSKPYVFSDKIYFFEQSDKQKATRKVELWCSSPAPMIHYEVISRRLPGYVLQEAFRDDNTKLFRQSLQFRELPLVSGEEMVKILSAF